MIGHHGMTGQQDAVERWIIIHSQKQPRVKVHDLLHSATLFFQNSFHFTLFWHRVGAGRGRLWMWLNDNFSMPSCLCLSEQTN